VILINILVTGECPIVFVRVLKRMKIILYIIRVLVHPIPPELTGIGVFRNTIITDESGSAEIGLVLISFCLFLISVFGFLSDFEQTYQLTWASMGRKEQLDELIDGNELMKSKPIDLSNWPASLDGFVFDFDGYRRTQAFCMIGLRLEEVDPEWIDGC